MSSELLYFCLMCLGWLFLAGWGVALIVACTVAFRQMKPAAGEERSRRSARGD